MKRLIILSLSLYLTACYYQNNVFNHKTEDKKIIVTKRRLNSNEFTRPCVETEGDYETKSKCVHIENTCKSSPNWCGKVSFTVTDKATGKTQRLNGWDWTTQAAMKDFKFYGYRAKSQDRVYEIDVRDDSEDLHAPEYYREWSKDMKKVLFKEKIM